MIQKPSFNFLKPSRLSSIRVKMKFNYIIITSWCLRIAWYGLCLVDYCLLPLYWLLPVYVDVTNQYQSESYFIIMFKISIIEFDPTIISCILFILKRYTEAVNICNIYIYIVQLVQNDSTNMLISNFPWIMNFDIFKFI